MRSTNELLFVVDADRGTDTDAVPVGVLVCGVLQTLVERGDAVDGGPDGVNGRAPRATCSCGRVDNGVTTRRPADLTHEVANAKDEAHGAEDVQQLGVHLWVLLLGCRVDEGVLLLCCAVRSLCVFLLLFVWTSWMRSDKGRAVSLGLEGRAVTSGQINVAGRSCSGNQRGPEQRRCAVGLLLSLGAVCVASGSKGRIEFVVCLLLEEPINQQQNTPLS